VILSNAPNPVAASVSYRTLA